MLFKFLPLVCLLATCHSQDVIDGNRPPETDEAGNRSRRDVDPQTGDLKLEILARLFNPTMEKSASPPAPPVQRGSGCTQPRDCEVVVPPIAPPAHPTTPELAPYINTIQQMQQTINLQAQTIQALLNSLQNQASLGLATQSVTDLTEQLKNAVHNVSTAITHLTPPLPGSGQDSGYKYNNETGRYYKWHAEAAVWMRANESCVAEGAQLAIINGKEEARFFKEMVAKNELYDVHAGYYREQGGEWRTLNGESPEEAAGFSPWFSGWPREAKARMYGVVSKFGALGNVDKFFTSAFICEKGTL